MITTYMSVIIRTFAEYEEGFTVGEESWLGLKQLAELTKVVVTNVFQCTLIPMLKDGQYDIKPRKENGSSRLSSDLGEASRPRLQPTPDSPSVRLPGSNRENTTISISMLDILKRQPSPSSCWIFGKGNHLNLMLDAGTN